MPISEWTLSTMAAPAYDIVRRVELAGWTFPRTLEHLAMG